MTRAFQNPTHVLVRKAFYQKTFKAVYDNFDIFWGNFSRASPKLTPPRTRRVLCLPGA